MASGIKTGRDGYVNGVLCTTSWARSRTGSNSRYAASCTAGGTGVNNGNINETGTIAGLGGSPPTFVMPGTQQTFKGVVDNTPGNVEVLDGTVLFTSLSITCPKAAGGNIAWNAGFGVQGELTPGATGAADSNYVEHLGASEAIAPVLYDGGANYSVPGFQAWTLNLSCPEKAFVEDRLTYRRAGNLEVDLSIDVLDSNDRNSKYDVNVVDKIKLYIDETTYWHIEWAKFTASSGIRVNRETQELIGYTINAMWTAVHGSALGHITRPNGTHLFGT